MLSVGVFICMEFSPQGNLPFPACKLMLIQKGVKADSGLF